MTTIESLRAQLAEADAREKEVYGTFAASGREQMDAQELAAFRAAKATAASLQEKITREENNLILSRNTRPEKPTGRVEFVDVGNAFAASDAFKRYRDNGNAGKFAVELSASLLSPASGGGDAQRVVQVPGMSPVLWAPPTFLQTLSVLPVASSSVSMLEQDSTTNAADYHDGEGSEIAEATLSVSEVVEPVKGLSVALPISNNLIDDSPAVAALVRQQLPQMVLAKAETAVLSGAGGTAIQGILNRSIATTVTRNSSTENYIDVILRAAASLETNNPGVFATHVVMHPSDYATIVGSKTADDAYYVGSPFAAPSVRTIFGLVPVKSHAIAQGTALVYSTIGALLLQRQSVVVSISDQQRFSQSVTIIKCEMRLGLATPRKSVFVPVDFET